MTTTKLWERIEKLEEILAAVSYEFGELAPPEPISEPDSAELLSRLWDHAKSATYDAEEAMGDLAGIVGHWSDLTARAATGGEASTDGAIGADAMA